jgi:hypothetical protein
MAIESDDVLNALAEERRKQVEAAQIERQKVVARDTIDSSDLVVLNDHAQVTFTVLPSLLPYSTIDGNELVKRMKERFGVSFKSPMIGGPLNQGRGVEISEEQMAILPRYVKTSKLDMEFEDGFVSLNIGSRNFIAPTEITSITFTREHISVSLTGRSDVAEMIAKECWEVLWELAKGQVPRTFDELSKAGLQIVQQANSTTINLGTNPKKLFNEKFIEVLERLFGKKDGISTFFRKNMNGDLGKIPYDPIITVDEIHFKVNVPTAGGGSYSAPLRLSVRRMSEEGTNLITLVTQLPYEEHLKVVGELVKGVGVPASDMA